MNKYIKITGIVIVSVIIALIGYDLWVMAVGGKDASISQVVIDYAYQYPIGVLAIGILLGHLFWRMPNRYKVTKDEYEHILSWRKDRK